MDDMFPDSTVQTKPYQSSVLQVGDKDVILEQDPKAGPYVRVTITDKNGNVTGEFSISKTLAEQISGASSMTPEEKLALLGDATNYLPESARADFAHLSREGLTALIDQKPELAGQEFTKMSRLIEAAKTQTPDQRRAEMAHSFSTATPARTRTASAGTGLNVNRTRATQDDSAAPTAQIAKSTAPRQAMPQLRLLGLVLVTLIGILALLIRSTVANAPRRTTS
jgi:hypothetical protein